MTKIEDNNLTNNLRIQQTINANNSDITEI
jgi:hypothetical protein